MFIISYDIASKSLALSIIKFNEHWRIGLNKVLEYFRLNTKGTLSGIKLCNLVLECIDKIEHLIDTLFTPIVFDVVDLIPGIKLRNSSAILRTARLKSYLCLIDHKYLNSLVKDNPGTKFKVLLEYQMGQNDKSRNVCSQVLYHYSFTDKNFNQTESTISKNHDEQSDDNFYDVEIIGPSLKNKINMIKNKPLGYYMEKYATKYSANKNHSKENFLHWIKTKDINMITKIPKKNLDDIADSVNMTIAWVFLKSGLV